MKVKDLVVVIPTYKRESIFKTIQSIIEQSFQPQAIIIVDNYPNSQLSERLIKIKDLEILYFKQKENLGGAGGYYEGIKKAMEAGFNYVYTLDDDIICDNKAIENLFRSPKFSDRTVLASLILSPQGVVVGINHKIFDKYLEQRRVVPWGLKAEMIERDFYKIEANSFAGLLIPRGIVEEVGYPDPSYFIWYDDLEYTYRISRRFEIYLIPSSVIYHYDETFLSSDGIRSMKVDSLYKVYYGIRNSLLFKLSYLDFIKRLVVILRTFIYVMLLTYRVLRYEDNKLKRIMVLLYGFLDGVRLKKIKRFLPEKIS